MDITKYIPIGKENAVTTAQLKDLTGLTERQIRREINIARINGAVILSDLKTGYWLPDLNNPTATIKQLEHLLGYTNSHILNRYAAMKSAKDLHTKLLQRNQTKLKEQPSNAENNNQKT